MEGRLRFFTRSRVDRDRGRHLGERPHNLTAGFKADLEKYLAAGLAGWRVFRLGPDQITLPNVERLAELLWDTNG